LEACPGYQRMNAAMKEELDAIEKNRTWELVDLPHNKHPIDVR